MEKLYTVSKNKTRADCGSDHELLIAKFKLKLKKIGKTNRPCMNDLNQIPYDYTVEVRNRFKGLDLIDRIPDELISHASKIMFKILQARPHQHVNCELPDVQAGFRKGRGTRDQIANIHWIIEKAREFQKNIYFCFIYYTKAFDCVDHNKLENSESDGNTRPPDLPLEKPICKSGSNS